MLPPAGGTQEQQLTSPPSTAEILQRLEEQKDTFRRDSSRRKTLIAQTIFDINNGAAIHTPAPTTERYKVKKKERRSTGGMMMGARETEQYIDRLKRENFDMKLEVFHRREKYNDLLEKSHLYDELKASNDKLQSKCEVLQEEVSRQSKALREAVQAIDDYQKHVAELEETLERLRSQGSQQEDTKTTNTSHALSVAATPIKQTASRDPAKLVELSSPTPEHVMETPTRSASALKGSFNYDYADCDPGSPARSFVLSSPALSALSESSFQSVYGLKNNESTPSLFRLGADDDILAFSTSGMSSTDSPAVEITLADYEDNYKTPNVNTKLFQSQDSYLLRDKSSTFSLTPSPYIYVERNGSERPRHLEGSRISLSPSPSCLVGRNSLRSKELRRSVSFVEPEYTQARYEDETAYNSDSCIESPPKEKKRLITPAPRSYKTQHGLVSPLDTPSPALIHRKNADVSTEDSLGPRHSLFDLRSEHRDQQSVLRRRSINLSTPNLGATPGPRIQQPQAPKTTTPPSPLQRRTSSRILTSPRAVLAERSTNNRALLYHPSEKYERIEKYATQTLPAQPRVPNTLKKKKTTAPAPVIVKPAAKAALPPRNPRPDSKSTRPWTSVFTSR